MNKLTALLFAATLAFPIVAEPQACRIDTIAGGGRSFAGNGGAALEAELGPVASVRRGPDGLVYFIDRGSGRILRITEDERLETAVGSDDAEPGDGRPGPQTSTGFIRTFAFAPDGALYWLETSLGAELLRRLPPGGVVETVAGDRSAHFSGDGGPARDSGLAGTIDFTIGPDGSIYLLVRLSFRINRGWVRRIAPDGRIETIAGGGDPFDSATAPSLETVPALGTSFLNPTQILAEPDGSILVRDGSSVPLRRIKSDGTIEPVRARFSDTDELTPFSPGGTIRIDGQGRLYWSVGSRISRTNLDLRPEPVWTDANGAFVFGFEVGPEGVLWSTRTRRLERLVRDGERIPLAGLPITMHRVGDGGPATAARIDARAGIALGPDGSLFILDLWSNRVRIVRDGVIRNFAGTGGPGPVVEGGLAVDSALPLSPGGALAITDIAAMPSGDVLLAASSVVWKVRTDGVLERFAGVPDRVCGSATGCSDGVPAAETTIGQGVRIAAAPDGSVYLVHMSTLFRDRSWVLRRVGPDGVISTPDVRLPDAGRPQMFFEPSGRLVLRFFGNRAPLRLDANNQLVEIAVRSDSLIRTWASAPDSVFYAVEGLDSILRVMEGGGQETIVPYGLPAFRASGDGGPAYDAVLSDARQLFVNSDGSLIINDSSSVRRILNVVDCTGPDGPSSAPFPTSAASTTAVAAGGLFSVFGSELGPTEPVVASPDASGRYPVEIAGSQVLIGDRPAHLLFVSEGQINGVMPNGLELEGHSIPTHDPETLGPAWQALVRVLRDGRPSPPGPSFIRAWSPALFTLDGRQVAALNQDGTVNSQSNPAAPGSVVVLFATGGGDMRPQPETGAVVSGTPLPLMTQPVSVKVNGASAEVLYAGAAPGLVSGVLQVNARFPESAFPESDFTSPGIIRIAVGLKSNQGQVVHVYFGR